MFDTGLMGFGSREYGYIQERRRTTAGMLSHPRTTVTVLVGNKGSGTTKHGSSRINLYLTKP